MTPAGQEPLFSRRFLEDIRENYSPHALTTLMVLGQVSIQVPIKMRMFSSDLYRTPVSVSLTRVGSLTSSKRKSLRSTFVTNKQFISPISEEFLSFQKFPHSLNWLLPRFKSFDSIFCFLQSSTIGRQCRNCCVSGPTRTLSSAQNFFCSGFLDFRRELTLGALEILMFIARVDQ